MERGYYWVKHPTGVATPILFWSGTSPYHEQNMTPIGDRLAPPVPEREPGYYWVEGDMIALWTVGGQWSVPGDEETYDDLVPISERLALPEHGWFTWEGIGTPPTDPVDITLRSGVVIKNVSPNQDHWSHVDSLRYVR